MDDITFCLNGWRKDCMVTRCERHPDNIRDKTIPHSFSEFYKTEYCPLERPKEKDLVEVIRCKDCKNSEHWYGDRRRCFLWSEEGISVFNDGFCNYAEGEQE